MFLNSSINQTNSFPFIIKGFGRFYRIRKLILSFLIIFICSTESFSQILPGAYSVNEYLPLLRNKRVGVVANQASMVRNTHLVDTLLNLKIRVRKIFSPEHGFDGVKGAGDHVGNQKYNHGKIPVISLYGKKKKPTNRDLNGIDIMVFDLQDVGTRFFTYISTMTYVMEACAARKIPVIILDRPNPNGFYIDGPVLEPRFKSFVGLHPVPIVYGMTIGEYAMMVNGERWMCDSIRCNLKVIRIKNYTHDSLYRICKNPSPNLKTMEAIYLYPSLCLFEGTKISVGRGTDKPFEVIGQPGFCNGIYTYQPKKIPGVCEKPIYEGMVCKGFDLHDFAGNFIVSYKQLYLFWLQQFYRDYTNRDTVFNALLKEKKNGNPPDTLCSRDTLHTDRDNLADVLKLWLKDMSENLAGGNAFIEFLDSINLVRDNQIIVSDEDSLKRIVEKWRPRLEYYLSDWFRDYQPSQEPFFTRYFDLLAGTDKLRNQIIKGESIENIRASWVADIEKFKKIRVKYLLYPDYKADKKIYFLR